MSVGENIRRRRKQLSMNAEALAEAIGVAPTTIYRYENGAIEKVDSAKLEDIALVLKTTPADLMGWGSASEKPHDIGDQLTAPARSSKWRNLSEGLAKMEQDNASMFMSYFNMFIAAHPEYFTEERTDDDVSES